uniref:Uncharacterized protein n=1 Tax=viral metagenome TaxID=1070528 RepID=A0A6M3LT25_9ZZZZ
MKIVINTCFGGFSLSPEAYKELEIDWDGFGFAYRGDRDNPKLVAAVEKLGNKANGSCAKLKVIEIPDDVKYIIEEHDGSEHIAEEYKTWG